MEEHEAVKDIRRKYRESRDRIYGAGHAFAKQREMELSQQELERRRREEEENSPPLKDWGVPQSSIETPRAALRKIQLEVCELFEVAYRELVGSSQLEIVVAARQYCYWRIKTELGWSYPRIADAFNRDHTTVYHGVKRVKRLGGENFAQWMIRKHRGYTSEETNDETSTRPARRLSRC